MVNANHRRGMEEERWVLRFLREHGFPHAERTRAGRAEDTGDVHLDVQYGLAPGVIAQIKNSQQLNWSDWLPELRQQITKSGARHGFLVFRRRLVRPQRIERLAIMPLEQFTELLREAGYGVARDEEVA